MIKSNAGRQVQLLLAAGMVLLLSCSSRQTAAQKEEKEQHNFTSFSDARIGYQGRVDKRDGEAAVICWPGTSVTMRFSGTTISAMMEDDKGGNYYNVIVDDSVVGKVKPEMEKKLYLLAQNLKPGKHTLQLFKLTESRHGTTRLYGFELPMGDSVLAAPAANSRKIEFYGASIVCGFSNESVDADSKLPQFENNYLSYAAITARHFHADYSCIARSGIGFMVSWYHAIMPEMYDLVNLTDTTKKWDFKNYAPQLVVIYVGQNDADIMSDTKSEEFKHRFTELPSQRQIVTAYRNMVLAIREKYPDAYIICEFENVPTNKQGLSWPGMIHEAATGIKDKKIMTHLFTPKHGPGHPRVKDHERMAAELCSFIEQHVQW